MGGIYKNWRILYWEWFIIIVFGLNVIFIDYNICRLVRKGLFVKEILF